MRQSTVSKHVVPCCLLTCYPLLTTYSFASLAQVFDGIDFDASGEIDKVR